jgi:hypothetical protein
MESKPAQDIAALDRRFEVNRAWHVCPKLEAEIAELWRRLVSSSATLLSSSSSSSFALPFSVLGIAVMVRMKYSTVTKLLPSAVAIAVVVRRTR